MGLATSSLKTLVQSVKAYQRRTFADTPENACIRFDDRVKWVLGIHLDCWDGGVYLGSANQY